MPTLKSKKANVYRWLFLLVRAERLELSHLAALDPKFGIYCTKET